MLPEIGKKAPAFSAKNQKEETLTLDHYKGKKLVLYFYPKDDTPGCTAEACDLRDHYQKFLEPVSLNSLKKAVDAKKGR